MNGDWPPWPRPWLRVSSGARVRPVTRAKAGAHTQAFTRPIRGLGGCGADGRLSSYGKGSRDLAHEEEEGEGEVSDQASSAGLMFLSLQP